MSKLSPSDYGAWEPDTDEYVSIVGVQDYMVDGESVAYVTFSLRRCRWEAVIYVRAAGGREFFVTEEAAKKYVEREWARYVEDECE